MLALGKIRDTKRREFESLATITQDAQRILMEKRSNLWILTRYSHKLNIAFRTLRPIVQPVLKQTEIEDA